MTLAYQTGNLAATIARETGDRYGRKIMALPEAAQNGGSVRAPHPSKIAAPVIGTVTCQDLKTEHLQKIVNAAPTPGEGARVRGMISAMVSAGVDGGYLANPRLARVHWQARDRPGAGAQGFRSRGIGAMGRPGRVPRPPRRRRTRPGAGRRPARRASAGRQALLLAG